MGTLTDFFTGGGGNPQTGSVVTSQSLPKWLEDYLKSASAKSEFLSEEPFQGFPGQRLADVTSDQRAGYDQMRGAATAHQGDVDYSRGILQGMPQSFGAQEFQQYSNPFQQGVLQTSLDEVNRQGQITERGIQDNLISSGNFGGSRAGIRLGEHDRNQGRLKADTILQSNLANYQQAQNQFNTDQGRQLQRSGASLGLGGAAQQYGVQGANAIGQSGLSQQLQQQGGLDLAYQDFQRQQQDPYNKLGFHSNILQGVPATTNTAQTSTQPGVSLLQQIAGLGIAGLGAYGAYKNMG